MLNLFKAIAIGYQAAVDYLEGTNSMVYHQITKPTKKELGSILNAAHEAYRVGRDNLSQASTDESPSDRHSD
jgi:hypothetical protein